MEWWSTYIARTKKHKETAVFQDGERFVVCTPIEDRRCKYGCRAGEQLAGPFKQHDSADNEAQMLSGWRE